MAGSRRRRRPRRRSHDLRPGEDPPLFHPELNPAFGQSIRQTIGPTFALWNKWLGDLWSIGDWEGMPSGRSFPDRTSASR
jgi:hypothetical protein